MSDRSDQRWDIGHALEALDRLADWSDRPQADRAAAQTLAKTVRTAISNSAAAVETGWRLRQVEAEQGLAKAKAAKAESDDNLIEQIAAHCVTHVLGTLQAAGEPWDCNHNIDAALSYTASQLLDNLTAMCELPHVSIAEIGFVYPATEEPNQ